MSVLSLSSANGMLMTLKELAFINFFRAGDVSETGTPPSLCVIWFGCGTEDDMRSWSGEVGCLGVAEPEEDGREGKED